MKKFVLRGGAPLYGDVPVSGAKNAALPLLFATMLTRGVSRFDRVPAIGDVDVALSILSSYGARIERAGERVLIDTEGLYDVEPAESFVRAIRASSYLLGGALGRFGRVTVRSYGGCNFADRPIDIQAVRKRSRCSFVHSGASAERER